MRLKRYLNERYWGRVESRWTGRSPEIFVNPSKKEFKDASEKSGGYVRFIADPKRKEVYIWTANNIHADIVPQIYKKSYSSIIFDVFPGIAKPVGGKYNVLSADEIIVDPIKYKWIDDVDWSWADKYIQISRWIGLNEKFAFGKKVWNSYMEVFVNPSPSEIKEVINNSSSREVRFSAWDNRKEVYIWDADTSIHNDVEKEIEPGGEGAWLDKGYVLSGNAKMQGNKLVCHRSDQLDFMIRYEHYENLADIFERNWNWVKKYININTIMKKYKKDLQDKLNET